MSSNPHYPPKNIEFMEKDVFEGNPYSIKQSFHRASSLMEQERARVLPIHLQGDDDKELLELIFGDQFREYRVNEGALADFGYTIPQSVRDETPDEKETSEERQYRLACLCDVDRYSPIDYADENTNSNDNTEPLEAACDMSDSESVVVPEPLGSIIDQSPSPLFYEQYSSFVDDHGRRVVDLVPPTTANSAFDFIAPTTTQPATKLINPFSARSFVSIVTPRINPIVHSMSAEVCDANTPELVSDNSSDEGEEDGTPQVTIAYDPSPTTLHYFNQAAVHITTRQLVDDFVAAQNTNLAGGILDIDEQAELEKIDANNIFFGLTDTTSNVDNKSPSNFSGAQRPESCNLLPLEIDDLADPEYYLGPSVPVPEDPFHKHQVKMPELARCISKSPSYTSITSRKRAASPEPPSEPEPVNKKARFSTSGFTGQFELMITPLTDAHVRETAEPVIFGDLKHANGIIINSAFVKDPYFHSKDWREETKDDAELQAMMTFAKVKAEIAGKMGRCKEEEEKRRLFHLECAEARLTNRVVGVYRYEEGVMGVEEYVEEGVCVCWEGCWCSKFCTRFGDVLCPCGEHLILEA